MTTVEVADFPPGYRFGNYVVRELIGRGGMAHVYRAEHTVLNKLVALKVMSAALQDRSAATRRFLREGRAAAAVKHPNVVDITDVGVCDGVPYLVMELLQGRDLETYLREKGPLSDTALARLALPIIAGLAVAHDAGVVHRDLKPSNIFMADGPDGDLVPKVLDFGISKFAHGAAPQPDLLATPYGEVMGTPLYIPPEGLDGSQDLTPLSDQYSLGVVLYECVVGKPPLSADTLVTLLRKIATGDYEPPSRLRPDIAAPIERAILRAMSLDPRERFPHVRDLGRALWDVASPRTQLLWGRTFGVGELDMTARGSTRALSLPPAPPSDDLRSSSLASTRRVPTRSGGILSRSTLGVGLTLLLLGSAGAVAYQALGDTQVDAQPPVAVERVSPVPAAAPAALRSSLEPVRVVVDEAARPPPEHSRERAAEERAEADPANPPSSVEGVRRERRTPQRARARRGPNAARETRSRPTVSRDEPTRATRPATTASGVAPIVDAEFPGLPRKDSERVAPPSDRPRLGANEAPLLE